MAHQLTGNTIASTFEQLIYRSTTEPSTGTTTTQLLTSENDQTDDVGLPLYISTERVGIGVADPDELLELFGGDLKIANSGHGGYRIGDIDGDADAPNLYFKSVNRANSDLKTIMMFEGDTGNVGIGSASPDSNLEVEGGGTDTSPDIFITNYNDQVSYQGTLRFQRSNNDTLGTKTSTVDTQNLGGLVWMGVDSGANFDHGAEIYAKQNGSVGDKVPCKLYLETHSSSAANSNQLVLDSNGRIGMGIAVPTHKLHVAENRSGNTTAVFHNDGNNADRYGITVRCGEDAFSGAAKGLFLLFEDGDGNSMGHIANSSNIDLPEFVETSDARIKENIADTKVEALNLLNQLRLKEFNKKGHGKTAIGLIAQEVKDVMPELISTVSAKNTQWEEFLDDTLLDDDGNKLFYNIGTGILPYYFIKAVQELSAKVTALENA